MIILELEPKSFSNIKKHQGLYTPLDISHPGQIEFEAINPSQLKSWVGFSIDGLGPLEIALKRGGKPVAWEGQWAEVSGLVFDLPSIFHQHMDRWWGELAIVVKLNPGARLKEVRVGYEPSGSYLEYLLKTALVDFFTVSYNASEWITGDLSGQVKSDLPIEKIEEATIVAPGSGGVRWNCSISEGRIIPAAALIPGQQYQMSVLLRASAETVFGAWQISSLPCVCIRVIREANVKAARLFSSAQISETQAKVVQSLLTYDLILQVQAVAGSVGQVDQLASALYARAYEGMISIPAFGLKQSISPISGIQAGSDPQDGIQVFTRAFEVMLPGILGSQQEYPTEILSQIGDKDFFPAG